MPALEFEKIELNNDTLVARIFRNCLNPQRGKTRRKVTVYIDAELLDQYEEVHPRRENGSFGGVLSDDVNKSLAVWMQAHGLIQDKNRQ